jgi:uncharacterized phage protein (TIGR01671 family)
MRDILFRGRRLDNGEWVEGDLFQDKDFEITCITNWECSAKTSFRQWDPSKYLVDPETAGQYTELTDKNGRKIFDGDICEFTNTDGEKTLYTVIWDYHRWIVVQMYDGNDVDPDDLDEAFTEYAEIIGNIHDNPELLEATDQ